MTDHVPSIPLRTALIYAVAAGLWILFSDKLLAALVHDPESISWLQTIKGWGFVSVTALLLYAGLRRQIGKLEQARVIGKQQLAVLDQAEKVLRETEEQMRLAVSAARIGLWDWDLKTNQVYYSPEWKRQIGYEDREISNEFSEWQSRVHPDDLGRVLSTAQAFIADPWPNYQLEFRFRHKDGSYRWVLAQATLMKDEQGRPARMLGTHIDITERKQMEEDLRQQARLLDLAHVLVTGADSRIIIWNTWAEQFYGWSKEEALGKVSHDLLKTVFPEPLETIEAKLRATGTWEGELRHTRRDGSQVIVASHWQLDGGPNGESEVILEVNNDITALRQAEAEIRQLNAELEQRVMERTAQLEAKNRELETFTYTVSHDLKAPLRGIDGYSRLLLEDYLDRLDDEGRTFLYNVRSAAEQMNRLIDDLLAYSRLERRALHTSEVGLDLLIGSVAAECADKIQERGITLTVEVPCANVSADPDGLALVLRNLLDNALKFTRHVPHPAITIGGRETETSCILWVADNGIGFEMQYHDRIFEIFERLHRTEDYEGTGIGLAIVRKAVERMGGRVWAESVPGQGATFYLEIPK